MSKTKPLIIVMSLMLFFSASLTAQPFMGEQRGHRMMGSPPPTMIYMMLKEKQKDFNITDSQLDQVKNKVFALEEKIIPIKSQTDLHQLELKKLLLAEKSKDYGKIKAVLAKISESHHAIFIETLKTKDAIKSILTPAQQETIREAMKNRFKKDAFPRGGMKGKMHQQFSSPWEQQPLREPFDFPGE